MILTYIKSWRRVVILITLVLASLFKLITAFIMANHVLYVVESPDQRYRVKISQERGWELVQRYVYLDVDFNEKPFIKKELLFSGDFMDGEFQEYYPRKSWLAPNILVIGRNQKNNKETITIRNTSNATFKYVLIENYSDKFFIFNLEPNSTADLEFDYRDVLSVQAESINGERFGTAILIANEVKRGSEFLITLDGQNINIENSLNKLINIRCCDIRR